ncbi:hypothetical protein BO86DRAFT_421024 [Aspergillus japonicus CBS 114.51]|uniref:Zn(2)-C6 fungal-type domain-containing protein n=1 Tax=Aspergillus japonicus CBS 114.51 TaxID=1448312 RepID=A0A8T8WTA5_ASPJA|nr:hypothetical protein BO86DRAFT_421024 [Aspergillus japonicus CBS 114.51]RAH79077.1 hypothetical protein BO86DRAFT_421024 [Aspergillus japonicus CBS 114.51]
MTMSGTAKPSPRRVKCDEAKPSCQRCDRSNRVCEGYATPSIPFKVPDSQADRQLLHFYCCQAAEGLSSLSGPTLWTRLILQRCHTQPIIRNALVTLSALYQDYHSHSGQLTSEEGEGDSRPRQRPSPSDLRLIARSHRQLRMHLSSPQASYEVALICGVLFYAFESLIGQAGNAIRHLDQALILFQRYRDHPSPPQTACGVAEDILPHPGALLGRLDIQATPQIRHVSGDPNNYPETILVSLQARLLRHLLVHLPNKNVPLINLPLEICQERLALDAAFRAFLHSITHAPLPRDPKVRQHLLLLRIQAQLFHSVLLENMHSIPSATSSSVATDSALSAALSDMAMLLGESNIGGGGESHPPDSRSSQDAPPGFTLTTQLIAGLYVVCLKSSDPVTVNTALSLLQNPRLPRRDGLWDASVVTRVVERLKGTAERTIEIMIEGPDSPDSAKHSSTPAIISGPGTSLGRLPNLSQNRSSK